MKAVAAEGHGPFERRVRRVVSDTLGVDEHALAFASSLTDNLAADSLDLLQLVVALEAEFDLTIADEVLQGVCTYGDLVAAVRALVGGPAAPVSDPLPVPFWARIVAAGASSSLQRSGLLTPYAAETLTDDALAAGCGARLEMRVPASTSDGRLVELTWRFGRLLGHGVRVSIGRADSRGVVPASSAASDARRVERQQELAWGDRGTQACAYGATSFNGVAPDSHSTTLAPSSSI